MHLFQYNFDLHTSVSNCGKFKILLNLSHLWQNIKISRSEDFHFGDLFFKRDDCMRCQMTMWNARWLRETWNIILRKMSHLDSCIFISHLAYSSHILHSHLVSCGSNSFYISSYLTPFEVYTSQQEPIRVCASQPTLGYPHLHCCVSQLTLRCLPTYTGMPPNSHIPLSATPPPVCVITHLTQRVTRLP